jgi:GNAT superfamily N-acetyltransferase
MITVRPMTADDTSHAARVMDTAMPSTPQPAREVGPDGTASHLVLSRFHKGPLGCFVAEDSAQGLVGAILSVSWGSVAWLGPLAVLPQFAGQGIEQDLIRAVLAYWEPLDLSAQGLETFPESPAHLTRFAAFGFRPQFLTVTLVGAVDPVSPREPVRQRVPPFELLRFSQLSEAMQETMEAGCRRISERHYPGLDYGKELRSVLELQLGDTLLLAVGERMYGFAICHTAPASESGGTACYVKALLIDPAIDDVETLLALVEACEGYARQAGIETVRIGVNLACWEGYLALAERGYEMRHTQVRMIRALGDLLSDTSPFHFNDWR